MKKLFICVLSLLMLLCLVSCKNNDSSNETDQTDDENQEVIDVEDEEFSEIELLKGIERWGIEPGLGIKTLHELGYTGKGVNVAYCDQSINEPFPDEIKNAIVYYQNNTGHNGDMHGNATSSLLCGKNIGTAPDVNLYFFSYVSWEDDQQKNWVECLEQLIEKNKSLPEGQKIRMVGFSNNIRDDEPYADEVKQAIKKCNDNDIMVFWCGENASLRFTDFSDKDNPENVVLSLNRDDYLTAVPADSRTSLADRGEYEYWGENGGLSWTMPYTLGVYAIAQSIDYDITQEEIYKLVEETNYTNANGARVFQPVEFIAKVLEKNNRQDDADKLRDEYKNNYKYKYVLYNSAKLSDEDILAINDYVETIKDAYPILFDCKDYNTAQKIYSALQSDHKERKGTILGIQILGNSDIVAPFEIAYEAETAGSLDSAGTYYSDYFYQNLNNDISIINKDYSVYRQFENSYEFDLTPDYPLARLPLAKGEFKDFFNKYYDFVETTSLKKLNIVNFSNPIFASDNHLDDFGIFLDRLNNELKVIDNKYELYGNTKGQYPVKNNIIDSFNKANLAKVNDEKIAEIIINSHGQIDNIDLCYFEDNKEIRESVLNVSDINTILDNNYYYLDLWTCNNGTDMKNNLTTTALNGKAVGVFSANHIISNNGVDNSASITDMKKANFYYFYYTYLRTLNSGFSRSTSFYKAQYKYYKALMEMSKYPIAGNYNYQFNMNNLIDYENYGLLSNDYLDYLYLNDTYQDGGEIEIDVKNFEMLDVSIVEEDAGYKITLDFNVGEGYEIDLFDPPNGDTLMQSEAHKTVDGENIVSFYVSKEIYNECEIIMVNIWKSDDDRFFYQVK